MHNYIDFFNPDVTSLESAYQGYLSELKQFDAGDGYDNFNDFILDDADKYKKDGDGVTYVVRNVFKDDAGEETGREVVSYYTLSAIAIPYEDRIRLDEEEAKETGEEFNIEICGILSLEIKMFDVSRKYQDAFYKFKGEELPISAWIIRSIVDYAESLINNVLGFKAIFLHSVPSAEKFYEKNGFNYMEENMKPLHCVDSDYRAMYLSLRHVHMNYDE